MDAQAKDSQSHPKKGSLKFSARDLVYERWFRGRLDYKLHSGQRKIREVYRSAKGQLFVGEIARQFGKTYLEVVEACEIARRKNHARIKIGTAFHTDLIEFILPAFDEVLKDCPAQLKPKYKAHRSIWIFPGTKSQIKLVGLDRKPNGLRGNVIDLIILDEAAFMARLEYLYASVIIPATTHRPDCKVLVFSTPPESPAHEFVGLAQRAEFQGSYCHLTIYDNPMVNETNRNRLMKESGGEDSATWKREYLAQRVVNPELQIVCEWKDEFIEAVPRDAYYGFYHKYSAMDLGVRHNTATLFGYYEFRKARLVIEDEFVINGPALTTQVLQTGIKRKEKDLWGEAPPYIRVSDNNNPLLLQDLSILHELHFVPVDKGRLEEMINTLKMRVRVGGLIVHPKCHQLIGCLKYGIWDKKRDQFAESQVFGHFDALAALIYLVRSLDLVTNPIPADFQFIPDQQILFPFNRDSDSVMTLRNAFGIQRGKR